MIKNTPSNRLIASISLTVLFTFIGFYERKGVWFFLALWVLVMVITNGIAYLKTKKQV